MATALAAAGVWFQGGRAAPQRAIWQMPLPRRPLKEGFDAWIFIPADLRTREGDRDIESSAQKLVRIAGNYDQVNRLCSQIAEKFRWGFVNVNLRPYYAEGSKTVGYEIAEQLGWRLPDNIVCPMAGGSLITKIRKAFNELIALGLVEEKKVKFFGAQATGCSPISDAVKRKLEQFEPQKPATIARSLAIGNPADGFYATRAIRDSGGWAEDVSDPQIVKGIQLLAEAEGIFTGDGRGRNHRRHAENCSSRATSTRAKPPSPASPATD